MSLKTYIGLPIEEGMKVDWHKIHNSEKKKAYASRI